LLLRCSLTSRGGSAETDAAASSLPRSVPAGGAVSVGRRVYVGNLSFYTGWQELKDHFKAAGPVLHADVLMVRPSQPAGGKGSQRASQPANWLAEGTEKQVGWPGLSSAGCLGVVLLS
jgi:RNA recognition motif-containing protein